MASTDPQIRRLARQLTDVDKRLHDLETVPQLAHSSIDDGTLPVYDKDGNLVVAVGRQPDGTWGAPPLGGPVPPAPQNVLAKGDAGVVNVVWDGAFAQGAAAPLDFDGIEILLGGELAGAIHDRDGGSTTIAADEGRHVVSWRTRSLAARFSTDSGGIVVEVLPPPSKIAEGLAAAEGRIADAETTLEGAQSGIDEAKADAAAAQSRLDNPDSELAGNIAAVMLTETKKLIVSEQAILQHATLLGTTVVEQINVTGKLVGADGVFTGTVDFANVNVTGEALVAKLTAGSVDAELISGGSFAGQTFTGGAYYGGRFATSNEPFTDGGVQMDAQYGLRGWAPGSRWQDTTFQLSPSDGSLHLAANSYFTSPSSGDGLIVAPQTSFGNAGLFFGRNQSVNSSQAAIWRAAYSTARDQLMMRGGNGGGITVVGTNANTYIEGAFSAGGNVTLGSSSNPTTVYGQLGIIGSTKGADAEFTGNWVYLSGLPTSGSSTSLVINPDTGRVARSSSSRRYKERIKDWNPATETVLALQPRTWVPKAGSDEGVECTADGSYVGFVAEEVHDLGLTELVAYSEGPDGVQRPESLNYDRFTAAQQIVLRDHESRIQQLEERFTALEEGTTHGTA